VVSLLSACEGASPLLAAHTWMIETGVLMATHQLAVLYRRHVDVLALVAKLACRYCGGGVSGMRLAFPPNNETGFVIARETCRWVTHMVVMLSLDRGMLVADGAPLLVKRLLTAGAELMQARGGASRGTAGAVMAAMGDTAMEDLWTGLVQLAITTAQHVAARPQLQVAWTRCVAALATNPGVQFAWKPADGSMTALRTSLGGPCAPNPFAHHATWALVPPPPLSSAAVDGVFPADHLPHVMAQTGTDGEAQLARFTHAELGIDKLATLASQSLVPAPAAIRALLAGSVLHVAQIVSEMAQVARDAAYPPPARYAALAFLRTSFAFAYEAQSLLFLAVAAQQRWAASAAVGTPPSDLEASPAGRILAQTVLRLPSGTKLTLEEADSVETLSDTLRTVLDSSARLVHLDATFQADLLTEAARLSSGVSTGDLLAGLRLLNSSGWEDVESPCDVFPLLVQVWMLNVLLQPAATAQAFTALQQRCATPHHMVRVGELCWQLVDAIAAHAPCPTATSCTEAYTLAALPILHKLAALIA